MSRTEGQIRRAKLELAKRVQRYKYQSDPLLWLNERLGEPSSSFKWSEFPEYVDHEWDGDIDPLHTAWQTIADTLDNVRKGNQVDNTTSVGIESATGTSKTYWLSRLVYWFLDVCPNSLVITSAPSDDQLKLGLWSEISRIFPLIREKHPTAKKWKKRLVLDQYMDGDTSLTENSHHAVGFVTGTSSDKESEDKARGFHRQYMLIILEECTGIPHAILTAFQNTSTGSTNFIVGVGNPNNEHDTLHLFCEQENVKKLRVSAFDYPNIVMRNEKFAGAVTLKSIGDRTSVYGEDSPLWNAMVRGISPSQSTDALIRMEWVNKCWLTDDQPTIMFEGEPEITKPERHDFVSDGSYNAVGVDVANSEMGDKAATVWGKANLLLSYQEFQCPNATHLAYNLIYDETQLLEFGYTNYHIPTIHDYKIKGDCIGVDSVGVGVATINGLLDIPDLDSPLSLSGGEWKEVIPVLQQRLADGTEKEVPAYSFPNLRCQMYWELREDIRLGKVFFKLPKHLFIKLRKELTVIKYEADGTKIKVEAKGEIKKRLGGKSPNIADAVVYWNWTRKGYRVDRVFFMPLSAGE
jgi:hypothetical protein